ncbi:MAG TPA: L,D-transpeptidase [Stellaceae bacterium]|nr:L,D-transpeptidase [Stellaceae bacterium]
MSLVLRRTALFVFIVLIWAVVVAAARASTRDVVPLSGFAPGTIVVKTSERKLYFVLDGRRALRFPVGVGKAGQEWSGVSRISGKYVRPAWSPPDDIRRENPNLPKVIPGGAPNNPMGQFAMTLGDGTYAIHGTNRPQTVGRFVSHGCIRMYNADIRELYSMVGVGTPVIVER